ncbi:hypothetical protein D3C76_1515420 [compost metagenome]
MLPVPLFTVSVNVNTILAPGLTPVALSLGVELSSAGGRSLCSRRLPEPPLVAKKISTSPSPSKSPTL